MSTLGSSLLLFLLKLTRVICGIVHGLMCGMQEKVLQTAVSILLYSSMRTSLGIPSSGSAVVNSKMAWLFTLWSGIWWRRIGCTFQFVDPASFNSAPKDRSLIAIRPPSHTPVVSHSNNFAILPFPMHWQWIIWDIFYLVQMSAHLRWTIWEVFLQVPGKAGAAVWHRGTDSRSSMADAEFDIVPLAYVTGECQQTVPSVRRLRYTVPLSKWPMGE